MRADKFLAEKFGSRTKAAEAIERGLVLVNGKTILPKTEIREGEEITFLTPDEQFVSNGGYKLERAIKAFDFSCEGKVFADIGASTGGFTDCLLQRGAKRVYAVDVGESLLYPSLAEDSRVISMENRNARYLTKADFPERLDGVVADVSFISLRLIFPVLKELLGENGEGLILIKPQFECEKKHIGKSGIVTPSAHIEIIKKVLTYLQESGLSPCGLVNAPIRKGKNIEYILYVQANGTKAKSREEILAAVKQCSRGE